MDEVAKKIAALGLPGIILVLTMAATGLTGAAAITAALAFLGGPAGMLGGIAVLGLTGLITDALAKVGLEDLLTEVYCERRLDEPHGKLLEEIDTLSLFDGDLKERLKATVTDGCGCGRVITPDTTGDTREVIAILERVPGITRAHHRDFKSSQPIIRLRDGSTVKTWKNALGVDHVFVADRNDRMIYGGFVGWVHSEGLNAAITRIRIYFT
ncbi:serine/threonine kinase [Calothrix sp. NIES-4071]|nr:serine/threonine kinase [Calothrix sp. NIES-4071]BAZ58928.1 serine/threonine kinase [Calothrix sp. NIES-4105]